MKKEEKNIKIRNRKEACKEDKMRIEYLTNYIEYKDDVKY